MHVSIGSLALISMIGLGNLASAAEKDSPAPETPRHREVVWNNEGGPEKPGVTHHSFSSASMGREVGYCVVLPEGYADSEQRYPVVYFLHGAGGNENSDGPGFSEIVGRLAAAGEVPPVICVFPNGGLSRYRDHPDTGINVETMIIKELVPMIDRDYRTLAQRESRVLAGFSMGGGGAVRLGLLYRTLFSTAASWAGSVGGGPGHAEIPPELSADALRDVEPRTRLLMIVGTKDEATYAQHAPFVQNLLEAGYPFTLRTLDGVHHNLGKYYGLTGEYLARFLLDGIATVPIEGEP